MDHWWFVGRRTLVEMALERYWSGTGAVVDLGAGAVSLFPEESRPIKLDVVRPPDVSDRFVQASAESLPFRDGSFEVVGLFDVLEHLSHPEECLAEARRILSPTGVCLVTVPAHEHLWSGHDDLVGHLRRYSTRGLKDALHGAGFDIDWISPFFGFLLLPAVVRRLFRTTSPMFMPPVVVNRWLKTVAVRSASRASRSPRRLGLSIGAVVKPL